MVSGSSPQASQARGRLGVVLVDCRWSRRAGPDQEDDELVSVAVISPSETITRANRPRLALWSALTVLVTMAIVALMVPYCKGDTPHPAGVLSPAATAACAAAVQRVCMPQLATAMRANDQLVGNQWLPGSPATCTTPPCCANKAPCWRCSGAQRQTMPVRDPQHPLRSDSDPECLAEFSNPVDQGFLRPDSEQFRNLVWTKCPNVLDQPPGDGTLPTYLDHACYPGELVHAYTAANIAGAEVDCDDHRNVWRPLVPGKCVSASTGRPLNFTEVECTKWPGVDSATRRDLNADCERCAINQGSACSESDVREHVCENGVVPMLAAQALPALPTAK